MTIPMSPVPIERFLVAQPSLAAPEGFTAMRQQLTRGVPFTWTLAGDLALVLVVPTGFAALWRDADPLAIASASSDEIAPHQAPRGVDPRAQAPLRLIVRRAGITVASVPLAAGLLRISPDGDRTAAAIEMFVSGWLLHAGCVRGVGDYGSFIDIAWRPGDRSVMQFDPAKVSLRRRGGYLP